MRRTIGTAFLVMLLARSSSQETKSIDTLQAKRAIVNVFIADMSGAPSKGEQVIFQGKSSKKAMSAVSDAAGRLTVELPVGDDYIISVKSITDSTKRGLITIPSLDADESFSEPYKVNIKFEPARTYTLKNVHFDSGKSTLRPESTPALEELYRYLVNKESIKIEIAGHTDSTGKVESNLRLSQERADAIREYLIRKGIPGNRVAAKGYGSSEPVADNATEEGRQLNRRTEVRIL